MTAGVPSVRTTRPLPRPAPVPPTRVSPLPAPRPSPRRTTRPKRPTIDRFWGASIRLFHVDVLVVFVSASTIADGLEAPLVVSAFHTRFRRTIALAARDSRGVPTYFAPAPIARVLASLPFVALSWKRYRYRMPAPMMLPTTDPWADAESWSPTWSRRDEVPTRR